MAISNIDVVSRTSIPLCSIACRPPEKRGTWAKLNRTGGPRSCSKLSCAQCWKADRFCKELFISSTRHISFVESRATQFRIQRPQGPPGPGPSVSFARSGITVAWDPKFESLLELAEACDVSVRWSCRTGVCHTCISGLISGEVSYRPEPLDRPAPGNVLICCSQPGANVIIDL